MRMLDEHTLYKVLDGVQPANGGHGRYPGRGRWTRHLDPIWLKPCAYGYHLCRGSQVLEWLGPTLWVVEPCADHPLVEAGDKVVTCRVRLVERLDTWTETTARLFAADCADRALGRAREAGREPDERSWAAVDVARRYACGDASQADLVAAWDAARAAAGDAAGDGAWLVAWYAARAAARAAAWDAARAAAWYAAGDAAWYAAWYTARAAAWYASRDAAGDAARAAEREWQYGQLVSYLSGDLA